MADPRVNSIYFFIVQAYMASNVAPLYDEVGGTFLVKNFSRWRQFKKYLRGYGNRDGNRTLLDTPNARIFNPEQNTGIAGTLFSATSSSLARSDDLTTVFVGHGTGDKKYPNKDINKVFDRFDYVFLTGEKQREKMLDSGIDIDERKLIKIGNMRFDEIVNRQFDRQQLLEDRNIAEASRDRKIVLYAPTWKWGNGTLEKYALKFARELSGEYFFIIRPHAHDRMMIGKLKKELRKENLRNVYISNPSDIVHHDTMTDFELADLLISDVSSIIYDFLITRKPIITIDNEFSDTHGMPKFMDITSISTIYRDADQIQQTVKDALERFDVMRGEYEQMLADVFYFNDGKSVKRAAEFLKSNSADS